MMETAEIKHGRLAMIAIVTYVLEELFTGLPVVQLTPYLFWSCDNIFHNYYNYHIDNINSFCFDIIKASQNIISFCFDILDGKLLQLFCKIPATFLQNLKKMDLGKVFWFYKNEKWSFLPNFFLEEIPDSRFLKNCRNFLWIFCCNRFSKSAAFGRSGARSATFSQPYS